MKTSYHRSGSILTPRTDLNRRLDLTRLHYRRYFPDALELDKEIFPKESPFDNRPIMRGQSRGLKKSWFQNLFGSSKQDESGQLTTEHQVGYFKGRIRVYNDKEEEKHKEEKREKMEELMELIA